MWGKRIFYDCGEYNEKERMKTKVYKKTIKMQKNARTIGVNL